jgi:hypothetical protein
MSESSGGEVERGKAEDLGQKDPEKTRFTKVKKWAGRVLLSGLLASGHAGEGMKGVNAESGGGKKTGIGLVDTEAFLKNERAGKAYLNGSEFYNLPVEEKCRKLITASKSKLFDSSEDFVISVVDKVADLPQSSERDDCVLGVFSEIDLRNTRVGLNVRALLRNQIGMVERGGSREERKNLQEWVDKAVLALAKKSDRESLYKGAVQSLREIQYYDDDDIYRIYRKAYPKRLEIDEMLAYYRQYQKQKGADDPNFFGSVYWYGALLPEEKNLFLERFKRAGLEFKFVSEFMDNREWVMGEENIDVYRRFTRDYARTTPEAYIKSTLKTGIKEIDKDILVEVFDKLNPDLRLSVIKYWNLDVNYPGRFISKLVKKLTPQELLVFQQDNPNVYNRGSREAYKYGSIFEDKALEKVNQIDQAWLPEYIKVLSEIEQAQWKAMAARNLFWKDEAVNEKNVKLEILRIEKYRQKYDKYKIFNNTIVAAHEEVLKDRSVRFGRPELLRIAKANSEDFYFVSPHFDHEKGDFKVTLESLKKAKERWEKLMINTEGVVTALFDGHGAPDAWYFIDGQIAGDKKEKDNPQSVLETEKTVKISGEEIALTLFKRYNDSAKSDKAQREPDVIILASCYSSNLSREIIDYLRKANMPLPIILTMSEYGQEGYTDFSPEGNNFFTNTILQIHEKGMPTIGGFIRNELNQKNSNPTLIVPDDQGRPMQISENLSLEPSSVAV